MVETSQILIGGCFLCWCRFGTRFSSKVSRLSVNLMCVCVCRGFHEMCYFVFWSDPKWLCSEVMPESVFWSDPFTGMDTADAVPYGTLLADHWWRPLGTSLSAWQSAALRSTRPLRWGVVVSFCAGGSCFSGFAALDEFPTEPLNKWSRECSEYSIGGFIDDSLIGKRFTPINEYIKNNDNNKRIK